MSINISYQENFSSICIRVHFLEDLRYSHDKLITKTFLYIRHTYTFIQSIAMHMHIYLSNILTYLTYTYFQSIYIYMCVCTYA